MTIFHSLFKKRFTSRNANVLLALLLFSVTLFYFFSKLTVYSTPNRFDHCKVLFVGGGTAGHVFPNIALIQYMQKKNHSMVYVGSKGGMEKQWIEDLGIVYWGITTGKLRRSLIFNNLCIPILLVRGFFESWFIFSKEKPDLVFSKGGFVSLPVVIVAWMRRVPIVVHESDVSVGLANRCSFPLASAICLSWDVMPKIYFSKRTVTGLPIRQLLMQGDAERGRQWLRFCKKKPILLVCGGSLGAVTLNEALYRILPQLIQRFQIVHLCGTNKRNSVVQENSNYRSFEFLEAEQLADVLACADFVVSRAGATAIYELLMLQKPHILCPLSTAASRGDQVENAAYLEKLSLSRVVYPNEFNDDALLKQILVCYQKIPQAREKLRQFNLQNGIQNTYAVLKQIYLQSNERS